MGSYATSLVLDSSLVRDSSKTPLTCSQFSEHPLECVQSLSALKTILFGVEGVLSLSRPNLSTQVKGLEFWSIKCSGYSFFHY